MKILQRAVWFPASYGLALASLACAPSVSWSADLAVPNTFVQGSPAVANEVNQNFSATAAAVNSKQDRVTGTCPAGQAVRAVNQNGTVVCESGLDTRVTSLESLLNYMPVGPQTNVPQARVNLGGWSTCYSELYNNTTGVLATILTTCNKANLMLACLLVGTDTYTVLAQAPRADVTFATPSDTGTVHVANGTAWYFNTSRSWGFAKAGDAVFKNSCDTTITTNADQRLCWHTNAGNLNGGWRCGTTENLNGSAAWMRVVLHRD